MIFDVLARLITNAETNSRMSIIMIIINEMKNLSKNHRSTNNSILYDDELKKFCGKIILLLDESEDEITMNC